MAWTESVETLTFPFYHNINHQLTWLQLKKNYTYSIPYKKGYFCENHTEVAAKNSKELHHCEKNILPFMLPLREGW